jgi:hypothetical protein
MSAHPPPVPPEQRPPHGGNSESAPSNEKPPPGSRPQDRNLKEQGRQGNIHENTRNTGYQQDR